MTARSVSLVKHKLNLNKQNHQKKNNPPMKQRYSTNTFTPSSATLDIIRQFAYTYRPVMSNGKYVPFFLN